MICNEGAKNKVLVVDDNELNNMILMKALSGMDFLCESALEGKTAVNMSSSQCYALIFMDCQMPEMDGYETTINIRKLSKPYSDVPIIGLSATLSNEKRKRCLDAGMNTSIQKPIDMVELHKIVEQFASSPQHSNMVNANTINYQAEHTQLDEATKRLMEEMGFTKDQAHALIKDYTEAMADLIQKLENAYNDKNLDELAGIAHNIKGVSCNMRFKRIEQSAKAIEIKSMAGENDVLVDIGSLKELYYDLKMGL